MDFQYQRVAVTVLFTHLYIISAEYSYVHDATFSKEQNTEEYFEQSRTTKMKQSPLNDINIISAKRDHEQIKSVMNNFKMVRKQTNFKIPHLTMEYRKGDEEQNGKYIHLPIEQAKFIPELQLSAEIPASEDNEGLRLYNGYDRYSDNNGIDQTLNSVTGQLINKKYLRNPHEPNINVNSDKIQSDNVKYNKNEADYMNVKYNKNQAGNMNVNNNKIQDKNIAFKKYLQEDPQLFDVLDKQVTLVEKLLNYIRNEKVVKAVQREMDDFDKLLADIAAKKLRRNTTTIMPTIKTVIDEYEIREALQRDPLVKRILKMAAKKRENYLRKVQKP